MYISVYIYIYIYAHVYVLYIYIYISFSPGTMCIYIYVYCLYKAYRVTSWPNFPTNPETKGDLKGDSKGHSKVSQALRLRFGSTSTLAHIISGCSASESLLTNVRHGWTRWYLQRWERCVINWLRILEVRRVSTPPKNEQVNLDPNLQNLQMILKAPNRGFSWTIWICLNQYSSLSVVMFGQVTLSTTGARDCCRTDPRSEHKNAMGRAGQSCWNGVGTRFSEEMCMR